VLHRMYVVQSNSLQSDHEMIILLLVGVDTVCSRRSWLRHCATNQQVTGSIPNGVIGIFHWQNPSSRTMALGSAQPLTEMSTRNICWGVYAAGA
jgi:hypothetical protein